MKIENRDRLNNIRGIAQSIDVFTDQTADDQGGGQVMANKYINLAYLYKRMPVLADTNGDHLIAASDLRTAIALAAAETGEVHPMPCKIGDKVYSVFYDDETDTNLVDELTVVEVGIHGVFVSACCFIAGDFGDYLPFAELGEEWYLGKEDAYKERERRNEVNERQR